MSLQKISDNSHIPKTDKPKMPRVLQVKGVKYIIIVICSHQSATFQQH